MFISNRAKKSKDGRVQQALFIQLQLNLEVGMAYQLFITDISGILLITIISAIILISHLVFHSALIE